MRVLYLGPTWRGSNSQSMRRAFELMGHEVAAVDTEAGMEGTYRSIPMRIVRRLAGGPLLRHRRPVREACVAAARAFKPQLVFASKTIYLDPESVADIRRSGEPFLIHWHPDDYANPKSVTPEHLAALPGYDVCVIPRTFARAEVAAQGARRVEFMPFAYDPEVHYPVAARPGRPSEACFVGGHEAERAAFLEEAARAGVDLEVWGPYWNRLAKDAALRRCCRFGSVFAEDMARVFASSNLSLGFLRKENRDTHTARTFEIPASGGLMLMERTEEQQSFFEEGKEALFFDTPEEMVATIQEYAKRPDDIARMRAAAIDRCRRDGYSYEGRLKALLARLQLA